MKNGNPSQLNKAAKTLLYRLLETESGGIRIYEKAVSLATHDGLREELEKYLDQTRKHQEVARGLVEAAGLDPAAEDPGRREARQLAATLVELMESAEADGDPQAAQLTACGCVVVAETEDHTNWHLLSYLSKHVSGDLGMRMRAALNEVEREEDEHLYHSHGWSRELWLRAMEIPAVLPPPEEKKNVVSAKSAARAEETRGPAARSVHH